MDSHQKILHSKIIGKGTPLLILHGLLGMGDNWISLSKQYAENGFEVHIIDQRNHGKSFHSHQMNYSIMNQDLLQYINHYRLTNCQVIGHSMGGKSAMNFAVSYPDMLEKLIVVDIAPKYYAPHHQVIFEAIKSIDLTLYNKRKEIDDFLSQKIASPPIRNFLLKNLKRNSDNKFGWKANIDVLEASLEKLGEALPDNSKFDKPTLFIKGQQSPYINQADFEVIKIHFPQANILEIANAGHWVHAEQSDYFFKKTLSFLTNK